jgi:hypothetical protein
MSAPKRLEGILYKNKRYPTGTTLGVSILSKDKREIEFVMEKASEWSLYANIQLEYVSDWSSADIRIDTNPTGSSAAYVGTDGDRIHRSAANMWLGWLQEDMYDNNGGTVTHEFGHRALAMPHEHQNPFEPIPWNHPVVYARYGGPPNNWDKEKIDHNIINVLNTEDIIATPMDRKSNMCYFFDGSLTLDGVGTSRNDVISEMDKKFVAQQYPYDPIRKEPEPINVELRRFLTHYYLDRYMNRATNAQLLVALGWLSVEVNPKSRRSDLIQILKSEIKKR